MARIWILIIAIASAAAMKLVFDTENLSGGINLPKIEAKKAKASVVAVGEDSFMTSPIAICVADGVSGQNKKLSSRYMSQWVTLGFLENSIAIFNAMSKSPATLETFHKKVIAKYKEVMRSLSSLAEQLMPVHFPGQELNEDMKLSIDSPTTAVGAMLIQRGKSTYMMISQLGDSSMIVLRKKLASSAPKRSYFHMIYVSPENESGYLLPYQIGFMIENEDDMAHMVKDEFEVKESDVVLMGSDGVFDNLYPGFIAMIINTMAAYPGSKTEESEKVAELTKKYKILSDVLVQVATAKLEFVKSVYKEKKQYLPCEENEFEKPQENSAFFVQAESPEKLNLNRKISKKPRDKATDKFGPKVDGWMEEALSKLAEAGISVTNSEKALWMAYFKCPIHQLVSSDYSGKQGDNASSDCLTQVLKEHLEMSEFLAQIFLNEMKPAARSKVIANVARYLSQKKGWPSGLNMSAWSNERESGSLGGKGDDITAIVTSVKAISKDLTSAELDTVVQKFGNMKTELTERFKMDFKMFSEVKKFEMTIPEDQFDPDLTTNNPGGIKDKAYMEELRPKYLPELKAALGFDPNTSWVLFEELRYLVI